jgi:hypothetical protein
MKKSILFVFMGVVTLSSIIGCDCPKTNTIPSKGVGINGTQVGSTPTTVIMAPQLQDPSLPVSVQIPSSGNPAVILCHFRGATAQEVKVTEGGSVLVDWVNTTPPGAGQTYIPPATYGKLSLAASPAVARNISVTSTIISGAAMGSYATLESGPMQPGGSGPYFNGTYSTMQNRAVLLIGDLAVFNPPPAP